MSSSPSNQSRPDQRKIRIAKATRLDFLILPHALQLPQLFHLLSLECLPLTVSYGRGFLEILSLFPLPNNSFFLYLTLELFQRFFKRFIIIDNNECYGVSPPFLLEFILYKSTSESRPMSTTSCRINASGSTAIPLTLTSQCRWAAVERPVLPTVPTCCI